MNNHQGNHHCHLSLYNSCLMKITQNNIILYNLYTKTTLYAKNPILKLNAYSFCMHGGYSPHAHSLLIHRLYILSWCTPSFHILIFSPYLYAHASCILHLHLLKALYSSDLPNLALVHTLNSNQSKQLFRRCQLY